MGRARGSHDDIGVYWRVYVAMWVAEQCAQMPGDFVECGTNTGLMSLAICHHLQFQNLAKHFYLFDTFAGTPLEQASESEIDVTKQLQSCYFDCFELATKNFEEYQNVTLVQGMIPDSLQLVEIGPISYLHVDLNLAYPERKAMEFFWDRLSPGAMMLLDDYGFKYYDAQKASADEFARSVGKSVLELPTGQGLVIK